MVALPTRLAPRKPLGFTLIELLVVIAIIGILVALLLPAVQKVRDTSNRLRCGSNLKQLSLGCHNYHNINGNLPPAVLMKQTGTGAVGNMTQAEGQNFGPNWVVLILPYIEQQAMYDSVSSSVDNYMTTGDSGWRSIRGNKLNVMLCASESNFYDRLWQGVSGYADWGRGNYACNAFGIHQSSSTAWTSTLAGASPTYEASPPGPASGIPTGTHGGGVMCINYGSKLNFIEDGASNTVMLGEVRNGGAAAPTDVRGTWALGYPGASVLAGHASWDCTTPNNHDDQADDIGPGGANRPEIGMGACITCPFQQAQARSRHTGGVAVAMCDGSVRFVRDSIKQNVWWMMNARDDGLGYAGE